MVGQNGATSTTEMRSHAIRTGAAALVSGRSRECLGRLILSDHDLVFVSDRDGSMVRMPVAEMAWISLSPRARKLTLEVTMRGAIIHYLRVESADWVSSLRAARERALIAPTGGVHHQAVALAG